MSSTNFIGENFESPNKEIFVASARECSGHAISGRSNPRHHLLKDGWQHENEIGALKGYKTLNPKLQTPKKSCYILFNSLV